MGDFLSDSSDLGYTGGALLVTAWTIALMCGRSLPVPFGFREYTTRCRRSWVAKNPMFQPGREPVLPHATSCSESL
ncbi:hypothetical protein [Streptomyces sp. NBC_00667]|nr:hypothetical protein [Streptomyces sp. NBC_00667]